MKGFSFQIHGKVQGVFFRKYTERRAHELGLSGWVANAPDGTVKGQVFGSDDEKLQEMKRWLQETGSPKCRIDKAAFEDATPQDASILRSFQVRRGVDGCTLRI